MKTKIDWIKDWQYWTIMLAFLICCIIIIIPKVEITMIEKPNKCVCECNFDIDNNPLEWDGWEQIETDDFYKGCNNCWQFVNSVHKAEKVNKK